MAVEIRPATPADILEYAKEHAPCRIRAYTGLVDGRIIGIGGIAYLPDGSVLAFLNIDEEARTKPVALMKVALKVIREAHARGVRVISATCDGSVEAGPGFLKRLGFRHLGEDFYQHEA